MTDWTAISNGATGAGTLVLALATFAAVRSSNRSARVAERSLLMGMRPVLVPSRRHDPEEKIWWGDDYHVVLPGGEAIARVNEENIYLAMSLRNVGNGIGVLQGWHLAERDRNPNTDAPDLTDFRPQIRDLYVPSGDQSFWQAGLRDREDDHYQLAQKAIENREPFTVFLLYSDHEGGQLTITRFTAVPVGEEADKRWLATASKHWFLDNPVNRWEGIN
jgi:hypothetical protein